MSTTIRSPKDPGHDYANTRHISFPFFNQQRSNAPFGYEYFMSLPPGYEESVKSYPLILFLHGAGESQRGKNESFASIRHGIPKIVLCYDKLKAGINPPTIDIPKAPRLRSRGKNKDNDDLSKTPVPPDVCEMVAENFITVTPSLNMDFGYGWNSSILTALLDEIVPLYRIDEDRIHVTGFSMGGYGTWELALQTPCRFATLMPICGGGDTARASLIKHVPQWVHHGYLDDIIPITQSQKMVNKLRDTGARGIEFTRYPDLMHDSWTAAYNNIDVFKWMLEHRRSWKGDEQAVSDDNKVDVAGDTI